MKIKLTLLLVLGLSACTSINVEKHLAEGTVIHGSATSLFSNSTLRGFSIENQTKSGSNLLKLTSGQTEPNSESITASTAALGELIGTAAKAAAKP